VRGLDEWVHGLLKSVSVMDLTNAKTVGTLETACNFFKEVKLKQPSLFRPI